MVCSARAVPIQQSNFSIRSISALPIHRPSPLFSLAVDGERISKDSIDLSIHDQTDMPAGHFFVFSLRIYAGTPINDFVLFGEDSRQPDTPRKRGESGLNERTGTLEAAAVRKGSVPSPP